MIWTAVLWMGILAHQRILMEPNVYQHNWLPETTDGYGNMTYQSMTPRCDENTWISIRRADDSMDKVAICGNDGIYHRLADDKPANHVFEIRIGLRVGTRKLGYCFPAYQGDITKQKCGEVLERNGCPGGAVCSPVANTLIRELWMDGVKLGILKGLD